MSVQFVKGYTMPPQDGGMDYAGYGYATPRRNLAECAPCRAAMNGYGDATPTTSTRSPLALMLGLSLLYWWLAD